jgi:hypothetical protein
LFRDIDVDYNVKFFDMKLLFLITALNPNIRTKVRDDFHGLTYLAETLDLIITASGKEALNVNESNVLPKYLINHTLSFQDKNVELINEILKVLFNLTVRSPTTITTEEEEESQFQRVAIILHDLSLCKTKTKEKLTDLQSNIVNMLTSVPTACYKELITPVLPGCTESKGKCFEGYHMEVIDMLLQFLYQRLDSPPHEKIPQNEILSPILSVMVKCVHCCSPLRRYIRSVVLPPLREVKKRPEDGTELRNYLCKLLTNPVAQISELTADFLFVLCKENVGRMVKYTGYGNAAGLFANRGLLGGRSPSNSKYSSDSEDSDTEEYKDLQHGINPVVGCFEQPKPNPLEGMSDEQKEYEAMQLVNLMDQLHRQGIVQPCRIGEDGRPVPVEHILELQNEIPEQQRDHRRKT